MTATAGPIAVEAAWAPPPPFDRVYADHFDAVYRSLRRLGVPDSMVDDAAQETFLIVHRKLKTYEARASLRTWVLAIALRVASDQRRLQRRKFLNTEPITEAVVDQKRGPDVRAEQAQALRLVDEVLSTLDDDKREAFVLAELEQLTAPEIAHALELNVNTVYARVRAARMLFEKGLQARLGVAP